MRINPLLYCGFGLGLLLLFAASGPISWFAGLLATMVFGALILLVALVLIACHLLGIEDTPHGP